MAKFKFPAFIDTCKKIEELEQAKNAEYEKAAEDVSKAICNMASSDAEGGEGGSHVLVATPYYKKWLAERQEKNIFIGKSYMTRAKEFERPDEILSQEQAMNDEELQKVIVKDADGNIHISDDYDPNNSTTTDDMQLKGDGAKFADLCTINKVIAKQVSWDFDSLMDEVSSALKEIHADDLDFKLPDNLDEQVSAALKRSEAIAQITYNHTTEKKVEKNNCNCNQ